jgi:DNA-binding NarL/FixJ family response regulator
VPVGGVAVRVVVADDAMVTREGIVRLLTDSGIEVVGHAQDLPSLLRQVDATSPDVAIVDIRMPPTHTDEGLRAAQEIRASHPATAVLLLSSYIEPSYALRLLEEHPERVGYLLKERIFDVAVLVDALRRVTEGETVVDPTIVARILGRRRRLDPLAQLSPREREVLALVAEGRSNVGIARELVIAERTVEAHITQIFAKLGLDEGPLGHRRVLAVLTFLREPV